MDRRKFLTASACVVGGVASKCLFGDKTQYSPLRISVDTSRTLGQIPADFTGLGYEISSVATPGLLSPEDHVYTQMVRTLCGQGVVRIAGNTSDYSSFRPNGKLVSSPKATVVNSESLRHLGRFLEATDWKLIWGLNLGSGSEQDAVREAQAIASAAGDRLLAFEIGNEPDLFVHEGHRKAGYNYEEYLGEYRRYKAAIRAKLPAVPFAGPDVARATEWVVRFAKDEGHDLKLLTHHYYRGGGGNPKSSLEGLLASDPYLGKMLAELNAASRETGIPYRICETNSFSGGGKPGVSDTFGAALWALDYMFTLAWNDAAGLNMQTGVNQLDFVSSYSPIMDDRRGKHSAGPDYYGMLAFAQSSGGKRLATDYDPGELNATAYAVLRGADVVVTVINKDRLRAAEVKLTINSRFSHASMVRLNAPSLESKTGIALAGSSVDPRGRWRGAKREPLRFEDGFNIRVPAGSAALVTISGK